ncbi:MAG: tetratricopeptide repeat protein [Desulfobacterales bacterium]|nr:tetratricopeptide repeat protein [Desulfobacterales bacterium]
MKQTPRITPLLVIILAGLLAWSAPLPKLHAQTPAEEKSAPDAAGGTELLPIPAPPLEQLEKAVAAQLLEGRKLVEKTVQSNTADAVIKARAFGQMGQLYMAYELNDAAEASLRNATTLDPSDYNWTYSLAYLLQIMGKYEDAISYYTLLIDRDPGSGLLHIRLGECRRGMNQLEPARRAYEKAYEINPDEAATLARLGEVALAEKRYQDAAALLTSALERQPGANRLHYPLAMAYRGLKDMQNARLHLSRMGKVGVQPDDPLRTHLDQLVTGYRVHIIAGKMAHAVGRPVEAIESFEKAMEAAPEMPEAYINIASPMSQLKKYRPAVGMLQKAIEIRPENETARFNLGALLAFLGDYETAAPHLLFVVEKKPDDALALLTLADLFKAQRRFDKAFTYYTRAVNLDSRFIDAWLWMSNYLINTGQYKAALTVLETAHGEQPREGVIAHALARLLAGCPDAAHRDGRRALALARKVFTASPQYEHARTLAMAYAETDQCDEAVKWQTAAIDAAVNFPEARPLLGAMNRNLNHFKTQRPCKIPSQ